MALRITAALRDALLENQDLKHAMANCVLKLYSGSQPATAETAPSGTLLCTISDASGALTREVLSQGSVALTGGAAGSVDTLAVNSLEIMGSATAFNTSLIQTATDIVTKINNNPKNLLFKASNVAGTSATITITAKRGLGTLPNGWAVASTATTITKTDTAMGTVTAGVAPVNGLNWGSVAAGVLAKLSTQTWSGNPAVAGTAGWFRYEAAVLDAGGTDASEGVYRIDGTIGSSGADLNMTTTITLGVPVTIGSYTLTLPTA